MKKIILSLTAFTALVFAGQHDMYPNSVSVVLGKDVNSKGTGLANATFHGFRYNKNIYNSSEFDVDTYQIAADFASADYLVGSGSTSQLRVGGNMIWSIDTMNNLTPYFLLGAGFSYLGNPKNGLNSLSLYSNVGGGAYFNVRDDFALTAEGKYIYYGPDKSTSNVNLGVKFSFGD